MILVRSYAAESPSSSGSPLAVIYHGGGWCVGDVTAEELYSRLLVSKLGMTVASINYRLAPEYRFPIAHNDCYDATKWVGQPLFLLATVALTEYPRLSRMPQPLALIPRMVSSSAVHLQEAT